MAKPPTSSGKGANIKRQGQTASANYGSNPSTKGIPDTARDVNAH